ncbi:hypothetical protein DPMN_055894 [Dreissena polymorpha]|uniref:DNA replication factor Dna2 N-terminal domain-containing protein n=1 Tax=Dreissena polymorpha TaxID=45954 RepID=A0A9D4CS76_DREPO|nr:hypothetical protein DPMN_055894 [Dreissena polymorpha]
MRKSILKEKFKGCDSRNVHMLYGSIIHSVFQQASNLLEMYANETSEVKVLEEVKSYIPQMITWLTQYTSFKDNRVSSSSDIQVTKVCDIEENIWSPR